MSFERHPGSISAMPDDQLGTVAVSLVVSELTWSPDVSPAVLDRVSRDAVAYPEQFDRRPRAPAPQGPPPPGERSAKRAVGRIAVFGVILFIILGLVAFVTAANASAADEVVAGSDAFVPIGAIDGTLVSFGVDQSSELYAVDHGGRILHVVTEAS
jgi:hypothetical protein